MKKLREYLAGLVGTYVQIERGGPEACQGWLDSVQEDYLTITAKAAGALYLPLQHIRSVSMLPAPPDEVPPAPPDLLPPVFGQLLSASVGRPIRIYHAGPEVSFGILREATDEYLVLEEAAGQIACFSLFHIRSLYLLPSGFPLAAMCSTEADSERGR